MRQYVRRVIEYSGDAAWIAQVMEKSLQIGKPLNCGNDNYVRVAEVSYLRVPNGSAKEDSMPETQNAPEVPDSK